MHYFKKNIFYGANYLTSKNGPEVVQTVYIRSAIKQKIQILNQPIILYPNSQNPEYLLISGILQIRAKFCVSWKFVFFGTGPYHLFRIKIPFSTFVMWSSPLFFLFHFKFLITKKSKKNIKHNSFNFQHPCNFL